MEGLCYYRPYVDPDFESLIEHINSPRVCIDNDACTDCTLVKVDSANKEGILLEMVQMLTDLELLISKSYICSDGGWLMDVFHVTDKFGDKITDLSLIHHIQQALFTRRSPSEGQGSHGKQTIPECKLTTVELTMTDQPGMLSEVSAVLAHLGCHVISAMAWTHNHRAACIIYVDDQETGNPIMDDTRLSHIHGQLQGIMQARQDSQGGEKHRIMLTVTARQTHTERRLHQLMLADIGDGKVSHGDRGSLADGEITCKQDHYGQFNSMPRPCTHVIIDNCEEKGYLVINIISRDRPKLLFDTLCALTDMHYMVFHAAISSSRSTAAQEYYVRHRDGYTLDETERHRVTQCLIAAVERRATQGLRIDVAAEDRSGLLSDVTKVFREYGLSLSMAEVSTKGNQATGTFYVSDASGYNISKQALEAVKQEIGGNVEIYDDTITKPSSITSTIHKGSSEIQNKPILLALGRLLWYLLEWISNYRSTSS